MACGIGYAIVLFGFNLVLNDLPTAFAAGGSILAYCLPLAVYLYGKKSVNEYYDKLENRKLQTPEPAPRQDD